MKSSGLFPAFKGWAVGYGSFTCSYMDMDRLIVYVKNQQEHHKKITFEEEYRILLKEHRTMATPERTLLGSSSASVARPVAPPVPAGWRHRPARPCRERRPGQSVRPPTQA